MKLSYLLAVFVTLLCAWVSHAEEPVWIEAERQMEAEQAELWSKNLAAAASLPPDEKFAALWLGLRNMGHRKTIPGHSAEIDRVYQNIQQAFLSLPGHAEYFADLLEKERAELESGGWRGDYDRHRQWYLAETLPHLPSPEAVKVLGAYLEDERDIPHNEDPVTRELVRSGKLKIDWTPVPDNARLAASAMAKLGLRDFPGDGGAPSRDLKILLAQARTWFAPIKSGEKAFSFKGQSVEYRFNPDGTWTTTPITNPPDDAPKPVPPTKPPPPAKASPPPVAPPPPPPPEPAGIPWLWIGAGALLLITALARLVALRGRRAG